MFPGHFEGPRVKGMCGRPSTTIGCERLFHPLVRLQRDVVLAQLTIPQADLAARLAELTQDQPVFVICHAGYRSLRVR
ncbi:MAG: hypothetical protein C4346_17935 [Chloroflexota bacterium]